jgi:hypothetical protein
VSDYAASVELEPFALAAPGEKANAIEGHCGQPTKRSPELILSEAKAIVDKMTYKTWKAHKTARRAV